LSPALKVVEQRPRAHKGDIFNASTDEEGEGADEFPDLDTPHPRRVEVNEDDLLVLPDFFGGKIFFLYAQSVHRGAQSVGAEYTLSRIACT